MVAASVIGEEAIVADTMETVREDVQQKAADELIGCGRHHLGLPVCPVVLQGETDLAIGERDQPAVSDGDAMGIAVEIGQHLFGAVERWLGVDLPAEAPEFAATARERGITLTKQPPVMVNATAPWSAVEVHGVGALGLVSGLCSVRIANFTNCQPSCSR
jgi:hypothetical protein